MVLVSAFTILVASLFIDRAMDKQFEAFVEGAQEQLNWQIVEAVRELYEQRGDRASLEEQLQLLGAASNVEIVVSPGEGHHAMMGRGMMGRGSMGMGRRTMGELILPDGTAATIEVTPTADLERQAREEAFRQAVNGSILIAAVFSVGSALFVSTLFFWRLTKPLQQLMGMVRKVGQGYLTERAALRGRDEIGFLGREFNQMAANLEQQERLRVKLTNDMAHELRTPLASIQAYLEGMGDGVVEPNQDNLTLVLEETQRLGELLESLQDLAKLERPMLKQESVDLTEVLGALVRPLRILAEEKNLKLQWESPAEGLYTFGDRDMLATAIRNVISNAIKYTPPGGLVTIDLGIDGSQVKVEISDTGVGIAAQELPFIFERFYRTDGSRSRATGGTGIGLAVTAEVIKGHGGHVEVRSEPGTGSTFTIYLPKIKCEERGL